MLHIKEQQAVGLNAVIILGIAGGGNSPSEIPNYPLEIWQHWKFGQLILMRIEIVATRGQILRLMCTKLDFGWGCAPNPAEGAYSDPQILAAFKGPTSREREQGEGKGAEGR